jgi:ribose transport system permease protein
VSAKVEGAKAESAKTESAAASSEPSRARRALTLAGPFAALALVVVLFALVAPDRFLTAYNLKTVATQTVIVGLGATGMTLVIVSGGIDLSVGSVIALASVVTAVLLRAGSGPLVSALGGVGTGAAFGAVNGLLVTRLRIVPFIVTLGTMGIARGLAKYLADEQKVDAPSRGLSVLMAKTPEPSWLLLSPGVWLMLVLAVLTSVLLRRTVFGVHATAVGSSEATARLCGVRVERIKVAVYALGGLFAGLAGVLQFCRLTVGDPTTALGKELDVIAAVVIGGGSLAGGSGGVLGSMIGAFLMAFLANGCTLTGVPNYVQEILVGTIIVAAVGIDGLRRRAS